MASSLDRDDAFLGRPPHDQRRFIRRVLIVIALVGLVALILTTFGLAKTATLTFFGGVLIGVLFYGVSDKLSSWTRIPRRLVLVLILALLVGTPLVLGLVLGPNVMDRLDGQREELVTAWQDVNAWLESRAWGQKLIELFRDVDLQTLVSGSFGGFVSSAAGLVMSLILMLLFGVYLAFDPDVYIRGFTRLFLPRHRERVHELCRSIGQALRSWLIGRFLSMAIVGVGTGIGLALVGVPLAAILGALAGVMSFVPNLGPLLSALPGILLGLTIDWQTALWAAGIYAGIQALDNYVVTPLIDQRAVSMPPALLIGFQMLMGLLAGLIGLFIATPLLVTIVVLVQALYLRDVLEEDVVLIGEHPREPSGPEQLELQLERKSLARRLSEFGARSSSTSA